MYTGVFVAYLGRVPLHHRHVHPAVLSSRFCIGDPFRIIYSDSMIAGLTQRLSVAHFSKRQRTSAAALIPGSSRALTEARDNDTWSSRGIQRKKPKSNQRGNRPCMASKAAPQSSTLSTTTQLSDIETHNYGTGRSNKNRHPP